MLQQSWFRHAAARDAMQPREIGRPFELQNWWRVVGSWWFGGSWFVVRGSWFVVRGDRSTKLTRNFVSFVRAAEGRLRGNQFVPLAGSSSTSCCATCTSTVRSCPAPAAADVIIPLTRWNLLPIIAPATPWRGIGIDGRIDHELVAGSNASTARNAPTSELVATSPPAT